MWVSNWVSGVRVSKGTSEAECSKGVVEVEGSTGASEVWMSKEVWEVEGNTGDSEARDSNRVSETAGSKGLSGIGGSCESSGEGSFEERPDSFAENGPAEVALGLTDQRPGARSTARPAPARWVIWTATASDVPVCLLLP